MAWVWETVFPGLIPRTVNQQIIRESTLMFCVEEQGQSTSLNGLSEIRP